jgi:hypothetical protein
MQNLNLSSRIQKVVCIANRLNIAPRSLRAGVEAELMEAAKELVATETNPPKPGDKSDVEEEIEIRQRMVRKEKDPVKLAGLVGRIRDLKNQLRQ